MNKDLLIMVLKKDNDQLRAIKQLQDNRINKLKECLESYTKMRESAQEMEKLLRQLLKAREDMGVALEQQLKAKTDQNIELTQKIEEMQAIIDGQAA